MKRFVFRGACVYLARFVEVDFEIWVCLCPEIGASTYGRTANEAFEDVRATLCMLDELPF